MLAKHWHQLAAKEKDDSSEMNTSKIILLECPLPKEKTPINIIYKMPAHLFCFNRHLSRALRTVGVVVAIAFLSVLCFGSIWR